MSKIQLYCRCEHCKEYFEVGGRASKIRPYCKRSCRDAAYYLRKKEGGSKVMNNEKLAIGDKVKCWKYGVLCDGVIHSVRKTIFGNIKYTVGVLIIDRYRLGLHHGVMTSKVRYFDFSENELMIQPNE